MNLSNYSLNNNDIYKIYEDYTGYSLLPPNQNNCIYLDDILKVSYIFNDTMGYAETTVFTGKVICKGKEILLKILNIESKQINVVIDDFAKLSNVMLDYVNNYCKIEKQEV